MTGMHYLKRIDPLQLFRLFVDGRYHKKYSGWIGYEQKEHGSVQAMLDGFSYMIDHFDLSAGLNSEYVRQLQQICLQGVEDRHEKSTPGDVRYTTCGMKFFAAVGSDIGNIREALDIRKGDGTVVFHAPSKSAYESGKTADELDSETLYAELQRRRSLIYSPWYPVLDMETEAAIEGHRGLRAFYEAKHMIQMRIVEKMDDIIRRYNSSVEVDGGRNATIKAIALLVRELELLHPFPDGNCRVFAGVLLTHLLLYNGFPPAMLLNPNLDGEYSLPLWIGEIEQGMKNTLSLLQHPKQKLFGFSIDEMPVKERKRFLEMSSELREKIDEYRELFLTSKKIESYSAGSWMHCPGEMLFTGIGAKGSYRRGCLYFMLMIDDWISAGRDPITQLKKRVAGGIRAIVIARRHFSGALRNYIESFRLPVFVVDNVFATLEATAVGVRQEKNPKTVLITGTEGKTGAKLQMHHLFSLQTRTHAVLNSANAAVPIRRSLADLARDDRIELLEFSVDAHMDKTVHGAKVVNPDYCFFTNIGTEHMHNHKTIEGVIEAKSSVVYGMREDGICFVNTSMALAAPFMEAIRSKREGVRMMTFGVRPDDDATLLEAQFDLSQAGWDVHADIAGTEVSYFLPMVQSHAPIASVGVLLMADMLGLDVVKAAADYRDFIPFDSMGCLFKVPMGRGNVLIYDQSRRASIFGVRSMFEDLKHLKTDGRMVALFGSISSVKDNEWTRKYQAELAELIDGSRIDELYTTGPNLHYTHARLKHSERLKLHSDDHDVLAETIASHLRPGDLFVVMGYMRLGLDAVVESVIQRLKSAGADQEE